MTKDELRFYPQFKPKRSVQNARIEQNEKPRRAHLVRLDGTEDKSSPLVETIAVPYENWLSPGGNLVMLPVRTTREWKVTANDEGEEVLAPVDEFFNGSADIGRGEDKVARYKKSIGWIRIADYVDRGDELAKIITERRAAQSIEARKAESIPQHERIASAIASENAKAIKAIADVVASDRGNKKKGE